MKNSLFCLALLLCGLSFEANARNNTDLQPEGYLTITFDLQRGGIASSQYAIWIENECGEVVRTLFVTSFTADGGYRFRPDALPVWVAKSGRDTMSNIEVDAFSGATPRSGTHTYVWDGTDNNGKRLPCGTYRFFVEGTLYWKSRILFSGTVSLGGPSQQRIPIKIEYFDKNSTNTDMITALKADYISL